ncbi:MAG: AMP-binding protein [Candidatus Saccharibacteria bacterium]
MARKKTNLDPWQTILSMKEPQRLSLGSQIEKWALEQPEKTFIIFNDKEVTYRQFNEIANRYADYFTSQGFVKGDVVALILENDPEYLAAVTGLSKIGVISALVHIGLRAEVLAYAINVIDAKAVIVGHELLAVFDTITQRIRLKEPAMIFVEGENPETTFSEDYLHLNPILKKCSVKNPPTTNDITSDDVLVYMYTSGSFGARKAVPVLQKRFLAAGLRISSLGHMTPDSVDYVGLPLYLNSGFNICFAGAVMTGSTMLLKQRFSVSKFWSDVRRYNVDYFVGVGEMARYLYAQKPRVDDNENPLKVMLCNGMWGKLIPLFHRRFGLEHVIEVYGTTEGVGVFVNYDEVPDMCGCLTLNGMRQGEVVRFDPDTEELLRDSSGHLIKCKTGETGILLGEINYLNSFTGYINDLEATASRIVADAFKEGDQYFNTKDVVKLCKDDHISFVDRLGDTYRWKGNTVSASNVADVIVKFFGGIEDAIVYGVTVPEHEGRCGMAAILMIEGEHLDWVQFTKHVNQRMPEHARPRFIRMLDSSSTSYELSPLKKRLRKEGYDLSVVDDPIYYYNIKKEVYEPLTEAIYTQITSGKIFL